MRQYIRQWVALLIDSDVWVYYVACLVGLPVFWLQDEKPTVFLISALAAFIFIMHTFFAFAYKK